MNDAEILTGISESLQRIHVITGWNLPEDKSYMKILVEEIHAKLKESFSNMTFAEINYSFRKNGLGIKDWGKHINLDLICGVLTEYLFEREKISYEEEKISANPPQQKINTDEELDNFHRQWTEEFYQRIRRGYVEEIPDYVASILKKDGLILEKKDASQFITYMLNNFKNNIYNKE